MRPVKFLEHIRTYPDCEHRVQWDLDPEMKFRSMEAAVEYMQANCAGRTAASEDIRIGYFTQRSRFEETVPAATFSLIKG